MTISKTQNYHPKPGKQELITRQEQATAHHEAGHAFAGWHFRYKVKKVTIVSKGDSDGYVVTKTGLHHQPLETTKASGSQIGRLHEKVVYLMAGHAAQRRFSPGSIRSHHASSDNHAADRLLSGLHSADEMPHVLRYLEVKARQLVELPVHWVVIQHLAGSLLKYRTMTGQQVADAICEGFARYLQQQNASCQVPGTISIPSLATPNTPPPLGNAAPGIKVVITPVQPIATPLPVT